MKPKPECDSGAADQTARHIVNEFPIRKLEVGIVRLASCDPIVTRWLLDVDLDIGCLICCCIREKKEFLMKRNTPEG